MAAVALEGKKIDGKELASDQNHGDYEGDDNGDGSGDEMLLPTDLSSLDAEVLSTLPQSLQLEILEKMRDAQVQGEFTLHSKGSLYRVSST